MRRIGGNTIALMQTKGTPIKNSIGERVTPWIDAATLTGWLDLSSGDSRHTTFSTKIQESTHIFLCDYRELTGITSENSQMVINHQVYEVLLIDNPMNLNEHLEIYLKFVGGQT